MIDTTLGEVSTFAGSICGNADGIGASAKFGTELNQVIFDGNNTLFVVMSLLSIEWGQPNPKHHY